MTSQQPRFRAPYRRGGHHNSPLLPLTYTYSFQQQQQQPEEEEEEEEEKPKIRSKDKRIQWILAIVLVLLITGWFTLKEQVLYWIPRIEKPLEHYPYWRARIFNPIRCWQVSYDHPTMVRDFVMTPDNAYVINLDRSKQRMEQFRRVNGDDIVQRFSATEWNTGTSNDSTQHQYYWQERFPFLRISSQKGNYGDAGCALSHLLLWQEQLLDANREYLFVFEDDAKLLDPLRRTTHAAPYPTIQAPDTADIVFLAAPAMKRVNVFWEGMSEPAVRVIGGYGAWGYIVTRTGALRMMEWLPTSKEALDVSFFAASPVKVYLPVSRQWPAVWHGTMPSTRLSLNHN